MSASTRRSPKDDLYWMRLARRLARFAGRHGEVPVGAVLVQEGQRVAVGVNRRHARRDILGHAEVVAVVRAAARLEDWRLVGATLYVTLEPCAMCAGILLEARVARVVYGASDPNAGAAGSVLNLVDYPGLPWHVDTLGGCMREECELLLEEFFRSRRNSHSP